MTVAVSCNLSEGVVLGVDSAVTLPSPTGGVAKVYEKAEKLFRLKDRPIGIATFGLGALGRRGLGSYIHEFEVLDPGGVIKNGVSLQEVVEALRSFMLDAYNTTVRPEIERATGKCLEDIPESKRPGFGLVVGGFSPNAHLSEVYSIYIPNHAAPKSARLERGPGSFGTNWFATFEPIRRYIKGYDPALLEELRRYCAGLLGRSFSQDEETQIEGILSRFEYQIPFVVMPLEEGIAHTRFLVDLVVSHHRYAIGAPVVGGRARIGTVSYRGGEFRILED